MRGRWGRGSGADVMPAPDRHTRRRVQTEASSRSWAIRIELPEGSRKAESIP
jgi:hypothetical protein